MSTSHGGAVQSAVGCRTAAQRFQHAKVTTVTPVAESSRAMYNDDAGVAEGAGRATMRYCDDKRI